MAYNRRRRYNKRKNYRRKRTRNRPRKNTYPYSRNVIARTKLPATIVPDVAYTVLKYVDRFVPTPALGANYHQVYSGTGLYDPDSTGGGHQPMGFDQWMNFYQYYRTSASKIIIRTIDNGSTPGAVQHEQSICPTISSSDLATADPEEVREMPYSRWKIVSTHTGRGPTVQSNYISYNKIVGRRPSGLGTNIYGSVSSNPGSQFFWHINGQVIDESSNMANVYVYVTIKYYVEFSGRKVIGQS